MLRRTLTSTVAAIAFATAAVLTAVPSSAQEATTPVAQTPADHLARAKAYREQAAQYRKAADEHKKMAKAYAEGHPDLKGGIKNSWNTKMQKHCMTLVKDYETLATDAEQAAKFHELRASE
jgi:gas vesicle protein